ncbi:TetR/AcrR family transcriptional regulator [Bacillus massiliigorillae]|uniref:TetR/AcrR family transcriptional regulator n=1 Tax=Bacillus massiliigorillae TaxID=1243664 RepID=UPI0003A05323|nr:TetR/AcrR family transcriptional regulator [Bacillus massiliigorillae]
MSKKEEIISAAKELIYKNGYQATSISDILTAANIGKGQFYHYFSSKYDLGLAVVEDISSEWEQELFQEIFQAEYTPKEKIQKMIDRTIMFHEKTKNSSGCPIGNLAIEMSEHDDIFKEKIQYIFNEWINHLELTIKELNNDIEPPFICPRTEAQLIVSMIEGGILLMKNQEDITYLMNITEEIQRRYKLI